ncbi:MAG: DEAD/DEAH box helicase [Thermoanaerobaculia bacterium]
MRDPIDERWPVGIDVLLRGRRWTVASDSGFADCRALRVTGSDPFHPSIARTVLLPFDRPRRIDSASVRVVRPRRWLRLLKRAAVDARPFGALFPAAAGGIDLHPYQMEPALAMLREGATRILIADAVGLGKTIQAGLIVRQLSTDRDSCRALLVGPASLRDQWAGELRVRFDLQANVVTASSLSRAARELPSDVSPWALPGVYICSFEFLRRPEVLRPVEDTGWDLLVVDEAHAATPGSARRAAVHAVALRTRRLVLLTATPHAGDDDQFRALCRIGRSEVRPDPILRFQRSRQDADIPERRRTVLLAVALSDDERRMHQLLERYTSDLCAESRARADTHARLLAIVLRKRALSSASVLARSCRKRLGLLETGDTSDTGAQLALPLEDEEMVRADDEPDTMLGVRGLADVARERHWLDAILGAAERASTRESKVTRLKRLLGRIKEPAIVFTEYRDTLTRLHDQLCAPGRDICLLHGGMTTTERSFAQQRFNAAGTLLLATDAASEGLNLHHRCRTVIHFELPWSPARLEQRTGRVDRIGQRRVVHEILLVASDTAERLVLAPLAKRAVRARAATTSGGRLAEILSESRVACAIMDGSALGSPPASLDPETIHAPPGLSRTAHTEARRIAELRAWMHDSARLWSGGGVAAVAISVRGGTIREGVMRVYTLSLTAEDGAIVHTELVALHDPRRIPPLKTPDEVRRAVSALDGPGPGTPAELLHLFRDRIQDVSDSCARAAAALSEREAVVSAPATSSAQQLVQRGLFDRRADNASHTRARTNEVIFEEMAHRVQSLTSTLRVTASLKLHGILLISGRIRS